MSIISDFPLGDVIGEVRLVDFMGGDERVVQAARVSHGVDQNSAVKDEKDTGRLINFMMRNRHGSPFEHSVFTFYVKAPLFVVREWQRHRIASYNEISGRYTQMKPEFYVPNHVRVNDQQNKQAASIIEDEVVLGMLRGEVMVANEDAYETYEFLLGRGVAREQARIVLPLNLYTQFYYTTNVRSLMNFLSLRNAEDAMWEIRQYAKSIENRFREQMPLTHEAFVANGRVAP